MNYLNRGIKKLTPVPILTNAFLADQASKRFVCSKSETSITT
jgi:hypothetical protein